MELLSRYPQFDGVIWRMDQVLLRAQVPLGRLDRRVAQEQLDLVKLAARCSAELGAGSAKFIADPDLLLRESTLNRSWRIILGNQSSPRSFIQLVQ